MLSKYTMTNMSRCSCSALLMTFWQVAGVLVSLNGITKDLYKPYLVRKVVGLICMRLYAHCKSSLVNY